MKHTDSSSLANKIVKIKEDVKHPQVPDFGGSEYMVEDWWDKVSGNSWMGGQGNPVCLVYTIRISFSNKPIPHDDEVLYGKIDGMGHLVHISEIETL